eukprot:287889-Prymnesium_polylepis.1
MAAGRRGCRRMWLRTGSSMVSLRGLIPGLNRTQITALQPAAAHELGHQMRAALEREEEHDDRLDDGDEAERHVDQVEQLDPQQLVADCAVRAVGWMG